MTSNGFQEPGIPNANKSVKIQPKKTRKTNLMITFYKLLFAEAHKLPCCEVVGTLQCSCCAKWPAWSTGTLGDIHSEFRTTTIPTDRGLKKLSHPKTNTVQHQKSECHKVTESIREYDFEWEVKLREHAIQKTLLHCLKLHLMLLILQIEVKVSI